MNPLFSILTPVYNTPLDVLQETIDSVVTQTFPNWEWLLVDDNSPDAQVREVLRAAATNDPRIKVIERETNGHIVAASNTGLAAANGEFIVLLDHDDLLTPDALAVMAQQIRTHPNADYLYSDEDKLGTDGQYIKAFRKPDWSPERFRNQMYTCHLSVLRRAIVSQVGGFHEGFDGSQDHDLVLRVTEQAREIIHVPEILYHWRMIPGSAAGNVEAKPYAWLAGQRAVQAHLDRQRVKAKAELGPRIGNIQVIHDPLPDDVVVSIVIATSGKRGFVWGEERIFVVEAVRSIIAKGGHPNFEIVVVCDPAMSDDVRSRLARIGGSHLKLVESSPDASYATKYDIGALKAAADYLIILDERTEITGDNFITRMIAPLLDPTVGMTGARLLNTDRTIFHAGISLPLPSVEVDETRLEITSKFDFAGSLDSDHGTFGNLISDREVDAVSHSIGIRRETYLAAGSMPPNAAGMSAFTSLSTKLTHQGKRILWLWNARAFAFADVEMDS